MLENRMKFKTRQKDMKAINKLAQIKEKWWELN